MNRDELLDTLAALVDEGRLTEAEAQDVLARFDAGELSAGDLPLPAGQTNADVTRTSQLLSDYAVTAEGLATADIEEDMQAVAEETTTTQIYEAAAAGAFVPSREAGSGAVTILQSSAVDEDTGEVITLNTDPADIDEAYRQATRIFGGMSEDAARSTAIEITSSFEERARALARAYKKGDLSIAEWQDEMLGQIRKNILSQAQMGSGQPLSPAQLRRLQQTIDEQAAYLRRFAEEVAARADTDNPMSVDKMVDRARQYGGEGYKEYYEAAEADVRDGVVVYYNSQDDLNTCSPCSQAETNGPYLPGQGPMPGTICLGRGKCRCERVQRYEPDTYETLI